MGKPKSYKEPGLIQASVHTTDVVIPACPMTEISNQTQTSTLPFQGPGLPAGFAKFYIFLKNETNGKVVEMSILNLDKTIFTSWTRTSNNDSKFSFWGYSKNGQLYQVNILLRQLIMVIPAVKLLR